MKISDVEKSTGLTAKAIRLYEEKGLISVERKNNRYRDYSADTVNNHQTAITESNALLGIDIGTTNISAVIIDIERNTVLETYTITNNSKLNTDSDLSECDTEWIVNKVKRITDYIIKAFPNIKSIGVTGQMHGIVYVDENGKAVSPLYTWQDGRGNRKFDKDTTYCQEIFKRTNYTVFSGYVFSTLFYNTLNDIQPKTAKTFCSIMDYVIMVLAGNLSPFIHTTNAASFGLYDIQKKSFDTNAVKKLGLSHLSLPYIIEDGKPIGFYQNIPVSVGIGDNQASFYGTVKKDDTSVLVNFGTGSQISVVSDAMQSIDDVLEIRPYLFGKYLVCGSALCGGKAYAILEKFFAKYAALILENPSAQYDTMNALAEKSYAEKHTLKVSTQFCGTRKEPDLKGIISGIDDENFTPENLILGVLQGMTDELKKYFDCMNNGKITELIASGNAVQKNSVLQMLLRDTFCLPVFLTANKEEAAIGAALYSGISNGVIKKSQIEKIITYKVKQENEL